MLNKLVDMYIKMPAPVTGLLVIIVTTAYAIMLVDGALA